jgi:glycosyltransferase involved in cell wall biosynthesis
VTSVELGLLVDSDAFGGAEVYVRQLLRRLPGHFRCHLVVAEPVAVAFTDLAARCTGVTVAPLVRGSERSSPMERLLAARPADVWHVNLVDPASNRAALAAAVDCAPTVATLHMPGSAEDVTPGLRALYGALTGVIAVSAEIAGVVGHRLGVPAERLARIRNGVDVPVRAPTRTRRHDPVRVGAVGRLTAQKGFDVLIAATALLVARGHRITVRVAGEGRDRVALERAADGLPVHFDGFVDDVPTFLRDVDLFCLPSRREALSYALLEAMAHALPCVTTPVGDVVEALGGAVRVVPVEDARATAAALEDLITRPPAAARLGARARRLAERRLDAAGMVDSVARVLAAAAQRSRPAAAETTSCAVTE